MVSADEEGGTELGAGPGVLGRGRSGLFRRLEEEDVPVVAAGAAPVCPALANCPVEGATEEEAAPVCPALSSSGAALTGGSFYVIEQSQ